MSDYPEFTPRTDQVREAFAYDPESEYRDPIGYPAMLNENRRVFDRWLAAHDAEVRASVVTEEPEWEYRISDGEFIHYTSSQSRVTRALQRGIDVRRRIPKRDATGWEAVPDA